MIRTAEVNDIPSIVDLLRQVAKVHHDIRPDLFMPNTVKYDEKDLHELLEDDRYYIGVYDDNGVKGYIICIIQETDSHLLVKRKTLYIDDLCVDEQARGLNIGKQLYHYAVNLAKERDCYNLTLNVWEGNGAKEFYESLGLKVQKTSYETIL